MGTLSDISRFPCVFMDIHGHPSKIWDIPDVHGCPWTPMGSQRCMPQKLMPQRRKCRQLAQYTIKFMCVSTSIWGFAWSLAASLLFQHDLDFLDAQTMRQLCGNRTLVSSSDMDVHGHLWISMDIHGNP
jgi:hypothetical protein